jgi:N-formylglutamate amidohydrolase
MELAQRSYMSESYPWSYDLGRAKTLQTKLKRILVGLAKHASAKGKGRKDA